MNEKFIYPAVYMNLSKDLRRTEVLTIDTYLRKKHRGKYYLWHFHRDRDIDTKEGLREYNIITEIEQFHGEVYRTLLLGKVPTKLVDPRIFNRKIIELDPDQTPEEERILPDIKY